MSEKSWPGLSNGEVSQSWGERYGYICQMIPSKFQFRRCTRRWHILILVQQCLTVHRVNRISLSKQPIRQLRNTFWRRIQMLTGLQQLREGLNLHNLFVIIFTDVLHSQDGTWKIFTGDMLGAIFAARTLEVGPIWLMPRSYVRTRLFSYIECLESLWVSPYHITVTFKMLRYESWRQVGNGSLNGQLQDAWNDGRYRRL